MSREQPDEETDARSDLVHELRQSYGLGASFFRAAAARIEMTDTDVQVIDMLERTGDATAGQLAQRMGLTTGTFTAILNRLEKAGLVRRERDPNDGRRVIVRLAQAAHDGQGMGPLFAALGKAWEELAGTYDDEQRALLLGFLERSNALARQEVARLRAVPTGDEDRFSAPLGDLQQARFVFQAEGVRLNVRAGDRVDVLYAVRFEGPAPDVKAKDGVVSIRYPRRLLRLGTEKRVVDVALSTAIPWSMEIRSGGSEVTADLGGFDLLDLEANGAGSMFRVELPEPTRVVPVRLRGGGSEFSIKRPMGVAARVQTKGWGSGVVVDEQTLAENSSDGRLQRPTDEQAAPGYDIDTSGSGSMFNVTSG